jgi:hypothetical protein
MVSTRNQNDQTFISLKSTLILSSHLRLGLPRNLFPAGLPFNILKELLLSSTLVTCPAHLDILHLTTLTLLFINIKGKPGKVE